MTFDPSTDFARVLDGYEPVNLQRQGGPRTPIRRALRGPAVTAEAAPSEGNCAADAICWRIPHDECPHAPCLGDAIVDAAGNAWTVLEVQSAAAVGRWDCTCRNLVIVHRLDDTITLERATYTKSPGGALTAVWHTWRTGVRARVQPVLAEMEINRLGSNRTWRRMVQRVEILLVDDLQLDSTFRVRTRDGTLYAITAFRRAARLAEPHVAQAEEPV